MVPTEATGRSLNLVLQMNNECVLITGADGYIGSKLVVLLLNQSSCSILMWVRASDEGEAQRKRTALSSLYKEYTDRITIIVGHFQQDSPFGLVNADDVTFIIHCAAVIRFNIDAELANAVNLDGTKKILKVARQCKNLKRYVQLSTLYTSGLQSGVMKEVFYNKQGPFANHYERSKCEAEHIIREEFDDLPWQILRLATVIADNEAGQVSQYNVFHNTMNLLYHGLISLIPGDVDTPLYFVTGDFSVRSIYEIINTDDEKNRIFHISHLEKESLTLQALLDSCFKIFSKQESFQKRNILRPLLTDLETFQLLGEGLTGLSASIVSEAVSSIQPFAPQLFIRKSVDNSNLVNVLSTYNAPDMQKLTENIVQHLITTKWGRN